MSDEFEKMEREHYDDARTFINAPSVELGADAEEVWQELAEEREEKAKLVVYAIDGNALTEIEEALHELQPAAADRALSLISRLREHGYVTPTVDQVANIERDYVRVNALLANAIQQRDVLTGQVDSLIARLAASHVSAGILDVRALDGFRQKETLPINQVLAQIAQTGEQPG